MIAAAMIPAPPSVLDADTDSDDSDVAFAQMDFAGVDFGGDDEEACVDVDEEEGACEEAGETPAEGGKEELVADTRKGGGLQPSAGSAIAVDGPAANAHPQPTSSTSGRESGLSSIVFPDTDLELSASERELIAMEKDLLLPRADAETPGSIDEATGELKHLFSLLENGQYAEILRSDVALEMLGNELDCSGGDADLPMMEQIKRKLLASFSGDSSTKSEVVRCIELEIIGIASLNLFLQLNYTGPSMDRGLKPEEGEEAKHPLDGINPHGMFRSLANKEDAKLHTPLVSTSDALASISEDGKDAEPTDKTIHSLKETNTTDVFHNAVLSELAVDGEWPFQVCVAPYFLLLARSVLSVLAEPTRPFRVWSGNNNVFERGEAVTDASSFGISSADGSKFAAGAKCLSCASLWNARAIVAHRRLISTRRDDDDGQACPTLWNEAEAMFSRSLASFCEDQAIFEGPQRNSHVASQVMLEWGLAQHHFLKLGRGKVSFNKALGYSGLEVEVTGAEGKRTKFQQKATAQYLVRAKPSSSAAQDPNSDDSASAEKREVIEKQMIKHDDVAEDAILLENIEFEEKDDNLHFDLSILHQSILLALCLDVKNDNPMDGLTGEQMGGYLARVLNQHDDWMVYATALLERAWLECERVHGRERAILQIQALADQHSNRLTVTQSTFKSVEEDSAPAQDRLRNLHGIVYPPRWDMLRDLAERYAKLGVVTSAAEMFEELELWDDVVECYRIAGKESKAVEVVRTRLAERETPRMYAALGDLTKDPTCFERSLELSNGKFYDAHVALGNYYFEKGDLRRALAHLLEGLEIKPLMPAVWFRVGTIGMQLQEWDTALKAFTEVVQQEPEEGDAWANVAAIHMHRKNPAEAYPALLESLKQNRNNWRVWVSKLYTCIDLKKYDEAIQTCTELLNLQARKSSSNAIPNPEERCIKAIVGGSLQSYHDARESGDAVALDSAKRTLTRVKELLDRMKSSTKSETWLYDVSAYFNEEMGWKDDLFDDLMKEYRTLQSEKGWEEDPAKISQMVGLAKGIFAHHKAEGTKESLVKCKLLLNGVKKKIERASSDSEPPKEVAELDVLLSELEEAVAAVEK
ncbi:hypothetical protein ACHAXT_001009 [Thalassiosira profunda]